MTLARHVLAILFVALLAPAIAAPAATAQERSVVVVFHPGGIGPDSKRVFDRLAHRERLSFGLLGATQGAYSVRQTLLDMTQGARISRSGYEPPTPPRLELAGNRIRGWDQALARAESAPATLHPGLLASSIPGGAGYVGTHGGLQVESVVAADREGRVASVSIGDTGDIADRTRSMLADRRLVVVDLPEGPVADRTLSRLLARRAPGQALLVIRTPPRSRATQLLPMGAVGLGEEAPGLVTSRTTRRDGFVTGIDVLPTVLSHLGRPIPDGVRGRPIRVTTERDRDVAYVRRLERRLRVVFPRRFPAMYWLFGSLAVAALAGRLLLGSRRTMRGCALALMWVPTVALITAALAPSRQLELILAGPGSILLGFLTDRWLRWPRAAAVPALTGVTAYVVDLLAGSPLIVRSLLGPNPRFGARFYGVGNELEAILPVLLLVGVAAAAGTAARSRRLAAAFAVSSLTLGAVVGAGRFGADVGGVITIGAGGAAATVFALPGGPSRRAILIACAVPVLAIAALAAIDLVTGGDSHFATTILGAEGTSALWDVVQRRTSLAFDAFLRGLMPLATGLAAIAVAVGIRRRRKILGPVEDRPAWGAALAGGIAAGVVGSLANDSGPVLLVLGAFVLLSAVLYLQGRPPREQVQPGQ